MEHLILDKTQQKISVGDYVVKIDIQSGYLVDNTKYFFKRFYTEGYISKIGNNGSYASFDKDKSIFIEQHFIGDGSSMMSACTAEKGEEGSFVINQIFKNSKSIIYILEKGIIEREHGIDFKRFMK